MRSPRAPIAVHLYRTGANLIAPLAYRKVFDKLRAQGVSEARLPERMGKATKPRPNGDLLWFHAASVGESVSILRLVEYLGTAHSKLNFLITSGTATSAEVVAKRLPPRTIHQFAPLDSNKAMGRFLAHWNPSAAVFVESELWPQMISRTAALDVPMALVNARISDRSAKNWTRLASSARYLLSHFSMIHCQDERTVEHLRHLGLEHAKKGVNLKSLAGPLPFDAAVWDELKVQNADRPIWLAASTHPGEEEIALAAQKSLLAQNPKTLLFLVPRHPERGDEVERLIATKGFSAARRSRKEPITPETQIYLADTLGEMGLWYALNPITALFGSFSDVGGHNPYEPAYAGSAVLYGPNYANFEPTYSDLKQAGAGIEVANQAELAGKIQELLTSPEALSNIRRKARNFAKAQDNGLESFAEALSNALALR